MFLLYVAFFSFASLVVVVLRVVHPHLSNHGKHGLSDLSSCRLFYLSLLLFFYFCFCFMFNSSPVGLRLIFSFFFLSH